MRYLCLDKDVERCVPINFSETSHSRQHNHTTRKNRNTVMQRTRLDEMSTPSIRMKPSPFVTITLFLFLFIFSHSTPKARERYSFRMDTSALAYTTSLRPTEERRRRHSTRLSIFQNLSGCKYSGMGVSSDTAGN